MTYYPRGGDRNIIYALKPIGLDGPYKIGRTSNLERRFRQMANANALPLELVASCLGGKKIEGQLHAALAHCHSHCEWFHDSPETRAIVAQIKADTLCSDELPEPYWVACSAPRNAAHRATYTPTPATANTRGQAA